MGRTLIVNGEEEEYEEDTTISEVKEDAGFPLTDVVTYVDYTGEMKAVGDDQAVEALPDQARVSSHPDAEFGC